MSRLIISNDSGGTCADHVNCVHLRRRLTCIPYPSPARLSPRLCRCQCLRALLDLGSSCVAVVCLCPSEFHYNLQHLARHGLPLSIGRGEQVRAVVAHGLVVPLLGIPRLESQ